MTPPSLGRVFGHYRLIEQVGAGGMGIVFRARDEQLHRDVAVKIMPPGLFDNHATRNGSGGRRWPSVASITRTLLWRLTSARRTGRLPSHRIHPWTRARREVGGQPLPQKTVLELGVQMMSGLEAAHRAGVIHRDLKPGNMRLSSDEQLKILDFGLAKVIGPIDESADTVSLDSKVSASGTLPYMAPELLRAEPADARVDIWAAGAVLYEMATGKRAFPDRQPSLVIDAILHYDPVRPTLVNSKLTVPLEALILKALDRDPDRRYQSARELRVDLARLLSGSNLEGCSLADEATPPIPPPVTRHTKRWPLFFFALAVVLIILIGGVVIRRKLGASRSQLTIHSIAVLPFTDVSPGGGQEYFAEGVTEELINDLSGIGALRVISRNSAMKYKGLHKGLPEIARELNVDAVVEGTVQRSENRVKISAALVDTREDRNIWGHSYQGDLRDVLSLQSDVAQAIASEIQVQLSPEESAILSRRRPVNPQAYETYLHALYLWNRRTPQDLRSALDEFKKAIDQDPSSALAWAGLADSYIMLSIEGELAPHDAMPLAEAAAKRALQLDNSLAQAHASLAITAWTYQWDAFGAGKEFARAIELNPSYAIGHEWYGMYLNYRGRFEEALREMQRAQELDPLSVVIRVNVARCYYYSRQYDTAVDMLKRVKQEDPLSWIVPAILGQSYLVSGKVEEAIHELDTARKLSPATVRNLGVLGDAYGRAGKRSSGWPSRRIWIASRVLVMFLPFFLRLYIWVSEIRQAHSLSSTEPTTTVRNG